MQKRLKRFSTKSDSVVKVGIEVNDEIIEGYLLDITVNSARVAIEEKDISSSEKVQGYLFTEYDKHELGEISLKRAANDRATISATIESFEGPQRVRNFSIYIITTLGTSFPVEQIMKYLNNQNQDSPYTFELDGRFTMADFYRYSGSDDILERARFFKSMKDTWVKNPSYQYERYRFPSKGKRVQLDRKKPNNKTDYLVFGSNDYLGFASDEDVMNSAREAIDDYGFGATGSPISTGLSVEHENLNRILTEIFNKESSLLFNSGYAANIGILSALCRNGDLVLFDQLSHASIQDALLMASASGAKCIPFKHNDMENLENLLVEHRAKYKGCLIVTEGIFSMDGYIAKIDKICDLADKYSARTFLDVAHDFGVLGENGLGAAEHLGVLDRVDIIMGTFSKIAGGIGGFCVGSEELRTYLRHMSRAYVFSVSIPPSTARAAYTALKKFKEDKSRLKKLQSNIAYFVEKLRELGVDISADHKSTICPVVIGCEESLNIMSRVLFDNGISVSPVVYPAVARSQCRFRFTVTTMHEESDLDYAALVLKMAYTEAEHLVAKRISEADATLQNAEDPKSKAKLKAS